MKKKTRKNLEAIAKLIASIAAMLLSIAEILKALK